MTQLSVHIEALKQPATDPLAGWLLPGTLVIGGVLAVALISTAFMSPHAGSISETMARELPSIGTIRSASAPEMTRVAAPAAGTIGQTPFAFGFLEFDGDPNAPGGVPGFAARPNHEPRVADPRAGR